MKWGSCDADDHVMQCGHENHVIKGYSHVPNVIRALMLWQTSAGEMEEW